MLIWTLLDQRGRKQRVVIPPKMIAAEFVDPTTGAPDAALTGAVAKACIAAGVIVLTCGTYGNVIRFLPPLSIGDDLLAEGLDVLAEALGKA